jgi:hypothetical protein
MGIPVDILIFRRECGKIKMSVESFHRHFHRHLYFPKFLLTNVNGNFADIFIFRKESRKIKMSGNFSQTFP